MSVQLFHCATMNFDYYYFFFFTCYICKQPHGVFWKSAILRYQAHSSFISLCIDISLCFHSALHIFLVSEGIILVVMWLASRIINLWKASSVLGILRDTQSIWYLLNLRMRAVKTKAENRAKK